MKKFLVLILAATASVNCGSAAQQADNSAANTAIVKSDNSPIVSSHANESEKAVVTQTNNKSASTESPMAKPVDVAEMTADIEKSEKAFQKNPKDEKAKTELAKAYFVRATALTGAAQYRSALGDYRKGLKLDATDEEARKMHDQIISIFKQIGREPPREGEEPKPLQIEANKN